MASDTEPTYLGREIDYLEDLGAKLRNLKGFATLAHELLQNADDVPGVASFIFDVRDDALIVENEGKFSDCGQVELAECPWKDDPANGNHRCDFHRFRKVAGGDKRNEVDTTGAFGIGFISVYQITDRPELISGRHWILDEAQPTEKRISVCHGCARCRGYSSGTRFYLPWASSADSTLRTRLRAEPTNTKTPMLFLEELERILPTAMLFLKKLDRVEIQREGILQRKLERTRVEDTILLNDGRSDRDQIWHVIRGDFSERATALKSTHGARIESKRSSQVIVAIPEEPMASGLLCATLPTQQKVGLPFHINADFFPTEDRKHIILEKDFQGEWNSAALACAAGTFSQNLVSLRDTVGHRMLWDLIASASRLAHEAGKERAEATYANFWEEIVGNIRNLPIVYTTRQEWRIPSEVFYLLQETERPALPLLEGLGLEFVHEDLRSHQNVLISREVGTCTFSIQDLAERLKSLGLIASFPKGKWPEFLPDESALIHLWEELGILLARRQTGSPMGTGIHDIYEMLRPLALAMDRDGNLRPCSEVFRARDLETEELFLKLLPELSFSAPQMSDFGFFESVCPAFGPAEGAQVLKKIGVEDFSESISQGRSSVPDLVDWFEGHRPAILKDPVLKATISGLAIYPGAGGFHPLDRLSLPGDFVDPLQMAAVLDVEALANHHDFLRDLGIRDLSFPVYVSRHLVPALAEELPDEKRRGAVGLLAKRRSEIAEDEDLRSSLASVPLIECRDGIFRVPSRVYLPSTTITEVLAESASQAVLTPGHENLFAELYRWLGARDEPHFGDIVRRIQTLVATAPDSYRRKSVQTIFGHLARRDVSSGQELGELRELAWLPARGDDTRWYSPNEVFATFQEYLFSTQASFLDIDVAVQQTAGALMSILGVETAPSVKLVVLHLLQQANQSIPVNREVYRFLNDKSDDPEVARLRGCSCLLLGADSYVNPEHVYWGEHPFGRFRFRVGEGLRSFEKLFRRIGVKEIPTNEDAIGVVRELSDFFGPSNRSLDDEAHAVCLASWKMLDEACGPDCEDEVDFDQFKERKSIPNSDRILYAPTLLFFEDRSGLTSKFGKFLSANTVPRSLGGMRAMARAGVRSLSDLVEMELLECQNPVDDAILEHRVRERHLQIARVLMAQSDVIGIDAALERLNSLRFSRVDLLKVSFRLHAFGQELRSEPEDCPALFQGNENQITFSVKSGRYPWASIARELALALDPEEEPGRIAPGLKEVLSAGTLEESEFALNELGFQPLEASAKDALVGTAAIENFGGATLSVGPDNLTPPPTPGGEPVQAGAGGSSTVINAPPEPGRESIEPKGGTGTGPAPINGGGGSGSSTGGGSGSTGGSKTTGNKAPRRGKLRSYVYDDPTPTEGDPDTKASERRSEIGSAGVAKVMESEESIGCVPREMPVNHPGYDVESCDDKGEILRYIEVKSMAGAWGDDGVGLTPTEFETAQKLGERFWLYVVERALEADFKIHFIQDPARKVDEFRYDSGWERAAEKDHRKLLPEEEW